MAIIEFAGETLESTDDHPFWVVAGSQLDHRPSPRHVPAIEPNAALPGRWVDAGDLRRSDLLHLRDGRRVPIRSVRTRPADELVYNFEVADLHTFAVGNAEALVHNRDPKPNTAFRALNEADSMALAANGRIMPKATGGTILDHIQGRSTKYISASRTSGGTAKFRGPDGVVEIDLARAQATGSGIVPHEQLVQVARKHGTPRDVANVVDADEILITGGIDPSAIIRRMP
jgi:hypothetical protein